MKALSKGGKQIKLGIRVLNSRPRNKINYDEWIYTDKKSKTVPSTLKCTHLLLHLSSILSVFYQVQIKQMISSQSLKGRCFGGQKTRFLWLQIWVFCVIDLRPPHPSFLLITCNPPEMRKS